MDIWHVRGGNRLEGACYAQGSKNASLPMLAASVICPSQTELTNVPRLKDVDAALRILRHLGCRAEQCGGEVYIDSRGLSDNTIPHSLMLEMRSSVIFMGALLARCGEARISLPGGCQLGKRPIDMHLSALRHLGAIVEENGDDIYCRAETLSGGLIELPFPSVGATENAMLAACAATGDTVIRGAAKEPEIVALQEHLRAMGATIDGAGGDCVTISSFNSLPNIVSRVIPDRIAAATICCAVAAAGGDVELRGINPEQFSTVLYFLKEAGCGIITHKRSVRIISCGRLKAVTGIKTAPYPGFPTDAQPVLMAALLKAEGTSSIEENIFENRYRQVPELRRLGASIVVSNKLAQINGVDTLSGTELTATDLRGGAAMIIAGLGAEGETLVRDIGHIARGYERFDMRLRSLGADIYLEY